MKQIFLSIILLLGVSDLSSQEVFKLGTVKGEHVTYQVREKKGSGHTWLVWNAHNPDTTIKPIPVRAYLTAQEVDIEMQIAEIVHGHLSPEELRMLEDTHDGFVLYLRVNKDKHELLQVTCFSFRNLYWWSLHNELPLPYPSESYDGFWLNLDPDRLFEIEKDIVKRVELPEKMHESFLTDDFGIIVMWSDICNPREAKEKREKAVKEWKSNSGMNRKMETGYPPEEL